MTTRSHLAIAVMVLTCLRAGPLLAQSAPAPDTTTTQAPAANAAPSAAKAGASNGRSARREPTRLRLHMSMQTRQQIEHAIKTRTVPSRYRSQVPKEYQKYIRFAR